MKRAIINFGNGAPRYLNGTLRLKNTAITNGGMQLCEMLCANHYPQGCPDNKTSPYAFKAFMFKEALKKGIDLALWIDSNVYVKRDLAPIFKEIEEKGYFFVHNGFNCAMTLTDNAVSKLNLSRDEAEKMPELTGCVMGLDLRNTKSQEFLQTYLDRAVDGTFVGSTQHNVADSRDPRFRFSRHDQPVASVIALRLGMNDWGRYGDRVSYAEYDKEMKDTVCLINQGL